MGYGFKYLEDEEEKQELASRWSGSGTELKRLSLEALVSTFGRRGAYISHYRNYTVCAKVSGSFQSDWNHLRHLHDLDNYIL